MKRAAMIHPIIIRWIFLTLLGCSACGGAQPSTTATAPAETRAAADEQIVFMLPIGNPLVPGPGTLYEVALMQRNGSGLVQLTHDGTFKFLPHFSPDATKIVFTKYAVGAYGAPNSVTDIAVYDLKAHTEQMITHSGRAVQGTWSPDGTRIAYLETMQPTSMWIVNADGSNPTQIAHASGALDDVTWGDIAWGSTNWILFTSAQNLNDCFKTRTEKIRPDGSLRTQVSDGGPNCTPPGAEQSGDADPGWSADGSTIYSSRGFPFAPTGGPPNSTERKLYAFSSDAWYAGKPERDLSFATQPHCIEGVPKGSPDGNEILLFRMCFDSGAPKGGIYRTDTAGSYRTLIGTGFGPDWNPKASAQ